MNTLSMSCLSVASSFFQDLSFSANLCSLFSFLLLVLRSYSFCRCTNSLVLQPWEVGELLSCPEALIQICREKIKARLREDP